MKNHLKQRNRKNIDYIFLWNQCISNRVACIYIYTKSIVLYIIIYGNTIGNVSVGNLLTKHPNGPYL